MELLTALMNIKNQYRYKFLDFTMFADNRESHLFVKGEFICSVYLSYVSSETVFRLINNTYINGIEIMTRYTVYNVNELEIIIKKLYDDTITKLYKSKELTRY